MDPRRLRLDLVRTLPGSEVLIRIDAFAEMGLGPLELMLLTVGTELSACVVGQHIRSRMSRGS